MEWYYHCLHRKMLEMDQQSLLFYNIKNEELFMNDVTNVCRSIYLYFSLFHNKENE